MDEPMCASYDTDVYGWASEQAALLRSGRFSVADVENIAGEIESLGKSQRSELVNRLVVLFLHLLKWQFKPRFRGTIWQLSIKEQRRRLEIHIRHNPSLKSDLAETVADAYEIAVIRAQRQTGLDVTAFPLRCPYSFAQAMDEKFWP